MLKTRYVNMTLNNLELAPYGSVHTITLPVNRQALGFENREEADNLGFIPIMETVYTIELTAVPDTIYIVPIRVKLDARFKCRDDIVCVCEGSQTPTCGRIIVSTLIR